MPTRFARQDFFPTEWQICTTQFLELFHRYGYIYKALTGGSWYSANEKWRLPDSEILKAIAGAHQKFYIGCRAGKTTRFAVLDIDKDSRYHNEHSLGKLLQLLADAGLGRSSLYRSSNSGGWHLYLFFDELISSGALRNQLLRLLTLEGFTVAKGQLEIFPHPGGESSAGLGLRLPLQPGFAWLNRSTLEVEWERNDLSPTQALELFVDALDGDANKGISFQHLKMRVLELESSQTAAPVADLITHSNVIPLRKPPANASGGEFAEYVQSVFGHFPSGIIVDSWYKGRLFHLNGLTGPSQRAEAIETLGHYLFYGDPSRALPALGYGYENEREWAIHQFLMDRNNGQSNDINRGRPDALHQVERAAHWRPANRQGSETRKYTAQQPASWARGNANRQLAARDRIQTALEKVKGSGRNFTTVDLQRAARCSRETLYKHADIWRKDYEDLAEGFFAFCTDEYNDVEQASLPLCSEPAEISPHPSVPVALIFPSALLTLQPFASVYSSSWWSSDQPFVPWSLSQSLPKLKASLVVLLGYVESSTGSPQQSRLLDQVQLMRQCLDTSPLEWSLSIPPPLIASVVLVPAPTVGTHDPRRALCPANSLARIPSIKATRWRGRLGRP